MEGTTFCPMQALLLVSNLSPSLCLLFPLLQSLHSVTAIVIDLPVRLSVSSCVMDDLFLSRNFEFYLYQLLSGLIPFRSGLSMLILGTLFVCPHRHVPVLGLFSLGFSISHDFVPLHLYMPRLYIEPSFVSV